MRMAYEIRGKGFKSLEKKESMKARNYILKPEEEAN